MYMFAYRRNRKEFAKNNISYQSKISVNYLQEKALRICSSVDLYICTACLLFVDLFTAYVCTTCLLFWRGGT